MSYYGSNEWIGKKFNMLTVMELVKKETSRGSTQWYWKCKCDCGNETVGSPYDIVNGNKKSCGCYRKQGKQVQSRHGESHTRLHNIWCGMNNRCNPNHKDSERYGKRGIRVCEEWGLYENFRDWALANGYQDDLTIERIDVNGNYCPENCKWIPIETQARNRRTTFWVEYQGEKMSLAEAAEKAGLPYKEVHYRIKKLKWDVDKALSEPVGKESRAARIREKCKETGVSFGTAIGRICNGWSEEDAVSVPPGSCKVSGDIYSSKKREIIVCPKCGMKFTQKHSTQIYCSRECYNAVRGRRIRANEESPNN